MRARSLQSILVNEENAHKVIIYVSWQVLWFSNGSRSKPSRKGLLRQTRSPEAKSHTILGIAALPQLIFAYISSNWPSPPKASAALVCISWLWS